MTGSGSFTMFLCEQLAPLGHLSSRRMFGAVGLFHDGAMFGLVYDEALYLRVDDGNRDLMAAEDVPCPLGYVRRGQPAELPYWRVPDRLLDEPDELIAWSRAALAAAARQAARRKGKTRRRKSSS